MILRTALKRSVNYLNLVHVPAGLSTLCFPQFGFINNLFAVIRIEFIHHHWVGVGVRQDYTPIV